MRTLKPQLFSNVQMENTEAIQLPHVVGAYSLYEPLITEEAAEDLRMMYVLEGDQLKKVEERQICQRKLGLKFLELITYNYVVIEGKDTEQEFTNAFSELQKWLQERYSNNQQTVLITIAKIFFYQDPKLLRGLKTDIENQLVKFRYKQFMKMAHQQRTAQVSERQVVLNESVKSEKTQSIKRQYFDESDSSSAEEFSKSIEIQQESSVQISEPTVLSELDRILILSKLSFREKEFQNKQEQIEQEKMFEQNPKKSQRSQPKLDEACKSFETTSSQMGLQFEVECYLNNEIKYPKHELTEFCHQLGFPEPTYVNCSKPKDAEYTVLCKMNFTSQYTKFVTRYYKAEESNTVYKKAQELAALRVLRLIYIKHKDLWTKFKDIKKSKNIKPG